MNKVQSLVLVLSAASALLACSDGKSQSSPTLFAVSAAAGPSILSIQACSLGCAPGAPGTPISCSATTLSPNSELVIEFDNPVDLGSVSAETFSVVHLPRGTLATGSYSLDPAAPNKVIFRPSLEFDALGTPSFGFVPGESYRIRIPGTDLNASGPYITGADGALNSTAMDCTLAIADPVIDAVPGPPTFSALLTEQLDGNGDVSFDGQTGALVGAMPLDGASDVAVESRIVLIFDDLMNTQVIASPLDGQSATLDVSLDMDGNPLTVLDQVIVSGAWSVELDPGPLLRTVAVFTPDSGQFPDGGTNVNAPRRIVLGVPNTVLDLVGNPLQGSGSFSFATVVMPLVEVLLTESFSDNAGEDQEASGARWGSGLLRAGPGGGSGRLGALHLGAGESLTLDTDSQSFPAGQQEYGILGNSDPGPNPWQYDPLDRNAWPLATIDRVGQGFEFSELSLAPDARLVLRGSRPARVFVRGVLHNEGVIDLSGETPSPHLSNSGGQQFNNTMADGLATAAGGLGGEGGPGAGHGGQGADRMDMSDTVIPLMINIGGIFNEGSEVDGRSGGGVGGLDNGTGGLGGVHHPPTLPAFNNPASALYGDAQLSSMGTVGEDRCRVAMVAGAGSGGAHALNGTVGLALSPFAPTTPTVLPSEAPPTAPGINAALNLEAPGSAASPSNKRNLEFWRRHLRGGAGGGGGGTSIYGSLDNQGDPPNCSPHGSLFPFWDHSAAGGGGGGGALMAVAGRSLTNDGVIDCRGGEGGSSTQPGALITDCQQSGAIAGFAPDCGMMAAPGGGGAGGAVRLQAPILELGASEARIDVRGGRGGLGAGASIGGDGSPGLVRLEYTGFSNQASDASLFAPLVAPYIPGDAAFNTPFDSAPILSIGEWKQIGRRPESYSGSQSCWMTPTVSGAFFQLDFVDDAPGAPEDLARLGWNMDIVFDVPGVGRRLFPFRGLPPVDATDDYDEGLFPLAELGGVDFATYFGNTINTEESSLTEGSYLAVRFQGARSQGPLIDPCEATEAAGDLLEGSTTPFVEHPALLDEFELGTNVIRFAVVFDRTLADFDPVVAGRVLGVTNLRIRANLN